MQGQKTKFNKINTAVSPSTTTQIAGVLNIEDNTETRASQDTTTMDQAEKYMTNEPGCLIDAGELTIEFEFAPSDTGQQTLQTDFKAGVNASYQLAFPDGSLFDFVGSVTEWGRSTPQEDRITRSVKFEVSGEPVLTPAP